MTVDGDSNNGPDIVIPGFEHLEHVDFERTVHTDDNL